jgi:prepilin-type N-terminal cleavage/methylation domain-containing protein
VNTPERSSTARPHGDAHVVPFTAAVRGRRAGGHPAGSASTRPMRGGPIAHRRLRTADQDGFTLVELLVVVLVLGALVGIAVPTFVQQRDGAWDAAVRSELRAATIALASYRAQNGIYSAAALATDAGWGYEASPDIITVSAVSEQSFCLLAWYRTQADDGNTTPDVTRAEWRATTAGIIAASEAIAPAGTTCPS